MRVVFCASLGLCVLAAVCSAQLGDILSPVTDLLGGGGGDLLSGLTGVLGEGPLSSLTGLLTNVGGLGSLVSGLTDGLSGLAEGGAPLEMLLTPVLALVLTLLQVVLQLVGVLVQLLGGAPSLGEALQGVLDNPVVQSQLNATLTTLADTLASGLDLSGTGDADQPDTLNNLLYLASERQDSDSPIMTVVRSVVALVLMLLQTLLGPTGLDSVVKIDPTLLSGFLNGAVGGLLGVDLTTHAPEEATDAP